MLILDDDTGFEERFVLDGEWLLKLRGGTETVRTPVREYERVTLTEGHVRRWLLFGPKRRHLRVLVHTAAGNLTYIRVSVERRPEVEAFFAAVERAKAGTTGC